MPNIWPWCWPMTLRLVWYVDLVHTYLPFKYGENRRSLRQSNVDFKVWPWTPNIWPWCWPMTLRSLGYIDLVYTYLPFKYGDDLRSLRQSNSYFKVWPWTPNIWPWWWPRTLRSLGYIDLIYTYLPFKYGDDLRSLRQSNGYFKVWPWTPIIWPWGQKFKIPPHEISAYWPKEHFCVFLLLSNQNCRTSSKNGEKSAKKRKWPWWPWLWPYDLDIGRVCWPCPYLPTMQIWSWSEVIKAPKCLFLSLTLNALYLTLRAKIQNSAAWDLCVLTQRTFLCVFIALLSKLYDKFQKVRKKCLKWPVYHPHQLSRKSVKHETCPLALLFLRYTYPSDFVMIGHREGVQKVVTDGRLLWQQTV